MGNDEDSSSEIPYYIHFREHLNEVQKHIRGETHDTLDPSFHPPSGYWTSEEKDKFFHGLTVYSRFRPDLIAEDIPSKTVLDVCVYLSLLNNASADERNLKRSRTSAAVEVSDDWVGLEEDQALALSHNEENWSIEAVEHSRKDALRRRVEDVLSNYADGSKPNRSETRKRVKLELEEEWAKEDCLKTLSDVHLRVFDSIVKVEEDDEYLLAQSQKVARVEGSLPSTIPDAHIDPTLRASPTPLADGPHTRPVQTPEPIVSVASARESSAEWDMAQHSPSGALNDAMQEANPELDLSSLSPRSRRRHQKRMYMRRKRAEVSGRVASASVIKLKPGRKGKESAHTREDVEDNSRGVDDELIATSLATVPSSNILNRAPFTMDEEEENADDDDIDVYVGKQEYEPTLAAIANAPPTAAMFQQEPGELGANTFQMANSSAHDGPSSQAKPKQRGLTLPYKIKAQFTKHGYDAKALQDMGMGLFHLSRFGKFMDIFTSIEADAEEADEICTSISTNTIGSLQTHLIAFVTDLLGRVIALQEHELRAKTHTKVWRKRDYEITAPCVRKALRSMNASARKRRRLEDLMLRITASMQEEGEENADTRKRKGTRSTSNDEDGDADDSGIDEDADPAEDEVTRENEDGGASQSAFRDIYAPFIFGIPGAEEITGAKLSFAKTATLRMTKRDEELLDSETDEDALLAELEEEEALDELDLENSRRVEEVLWEEMKVEVESDMESKNEERPIVTDPTAETINDVQGITSHFPSRKHSAVAAIGDKPSRDVRSTHSLRFTLPDMSGPVKSAVYIEDSD